MRFSDALDILFPRSCAVCGMSAAREFLHLCWDCSLELPLIKGPSCSVCGLPIAGKADYGFVCPACSHSRPSFDIARSALRYTEPIQKLITEFKYNAAVWLATDIASIMLAYWNSELPVFRIDEVVCVPLHPVRERSRSYNQSQLLAKNIAVSLRKPLAKRALLRTVQTKTQTRLTAAERKANVKGVFACRPTSYFEGKSLLLIDDVMTTGATLNECAKTLKKAGAKNVAALTFARRTRA